MKINGQPALLATDISAFERFGIDETLLIEAGVRRVTHQQARDDVGIRYRSEHLEGVEFPYLDPISGEHLTSRVRRDHPELESDGQPIAKYVQPPDRHRLFFPPGVSMLLTDATSPCVLVESEKASLALTAASTRLHRRVLAIATGGCWGWKGTIGKATDASGARVDEKGPLADFDRVLWAGRDVVILFDANAASNPKVQAARRQLAEQLANRGARVRIVDVPAEAGVNGPDDYRAAHDDVALFELLAAAQPASRSTNAKTKKAPQGREVQLNDPEPWPEPVDGAVLLDALAATCERYLVLPPHASAVLALWVMHAYAFDAWFTSPFLVITSPVMRCGKSNLLIVIGALTPRSLTSSSVTPAVLFRTIEKYAPTLLIDEADTFVRDNDELRGVLNSGHTKSTANVIRAVGDDYEPRMFSTWCPKAIALIGKLPPTLADRAISIAMRRRLPSERIERFRLDRIEDDCAAFRRQAARWSLDHLSELRSADPDVPDALHDRAQDCWRSLLAVADAVGGDWPERGRTAALALAGALLDDDADIGTQLLIDIREVFQQNASLLVDGAIQTEALLQKLREMVDRPWPVFGKSEKPLSSHKLARLLKPFGIVSAGLLWFGDERHRGYRTDAFTEAFDRYLPLKVSMCSEPNKNGPEGDISKRSATEDVNTSKTANSSMNTDPENTYTLSGDGRPRSRRGFDL